IRGARAAPRCSRSALATWTEIARALADDAGPDLPRAAAQARQPGTVVDAQLAAEVAGLAVVAREVAQRRAAEADRRLEHRAHALDEARVAFATDAARGPRGMDSRAMQGFAGVDVADPDH